MARYVHTMLQVLFYACLLLFNLSTLRDLSLLPSLAWRNIGFGLLWLKSIQLQCTLFVHGNNCTYFTICRLRRVMYAIEVVELPAPDELQPDVLRICGTFKKKYKEQCIHDIVSTKK